MEQLENNEGPDVADHLLVQRAEPAKKVAQSAVHTPYAEQGGTKSFSSILNLIESSSPRICQGAAD